MSSKSKTPAWERFEINDGPVVRLAHLGGLTVLVCLVLLIGWMVVAPVDEVAKARESTPARVSLAWLLRKPMVTSVIFGARNLEQFEDNLAAAELKLADEDVRKLDEASALDLGYPYEFMRNVQGRW